MSLEATLTILQTFAGAVLLATASIAGWNLKKVVELATIMAGLSARVEADGKALEQRFRGMEITTAQRFEALTDWNKSISSKLDTLVRHANGREKQ